MDDEYEPPADIEMEDASKTKKAKKGKKAKKAKKAKKGVMIDTEDVVINMAPQLEDSDNEEDVSDSVSKSSGASKKSKRSTKA